MATKLSYSKNITRKNAKRTFIKNAVVKVENGQTRVTVNKSMKNVKNGKNSK